MNAIIIDQAATDLVDEIATIADNAEVIRNAIARVEASLEVVLAMCADIQNTIHAATDGTNTAQPVSWDGTP